MGNYARYTMAARSIYVNKKLNIDVVTIYFNLVYTSTTSVYHTAAHVYEVQ